MSHIIEANTTLIEYLQNKNFYFLFTQSSNYSLRLFILSNLGNDDNQGIDQLTDILLLICLLCLEDR